MSKIIGINGTDGLALDGHEIVAGVYDMVSQESIVPILSKGTTLLNGEAIINGRATVAKYYIGTPGEVVDFADIYANANDEQDGEDFGADQHNVNLMEKALKIKKYDERQFRGLDAPAMQSLIIKGNAKAMNTDLMVTYMEAIAAGAEISLAGGVVTGSPTGRTITANPEAVFQFVESTDYAAIRETIDAKISAWDKIVSPMHDDYVDRSEAFIVCKSWIADALRNSLVFEASGGKKETEKAFKSGWKYVGHYAGVAIYVTKRMGAGDNFLMSMYGANVSPFEPDPQAYIDRAPATPIFKVGLYYRRNVDGEGPVLPEFNFVGRDVVAVTAGN